MVKEPIVLSDQIIPPPALVRAGLETLPAIIRAQGERAGRRFIEFFTATIRNRNTRMAYARAVKRFFDWCDDHHLGLEDIEPIAIAALGRDLGIAVEVELLQGLHAPLPLARGVVPESGLPACLRC